MNIKRIGSYILTIIAVCSLLSLVFFKLQRNDSPDRTVMQNIEKKNFIAVKSKGKYLLVFDLSGKEFLYRSNDGDSASVVIGNHEYSDSTGVRKTGNKAFYNSKIYILYYPVIANNVKQRNIKNNNYVVTQKVSEKGEDSLRSYGYYSSKVVIRYNKNYLPIYIKARSTRTNRWETVVRYDYSYNRRSFDRKKNQLLKEIKTGRYDPPEK